MADYYPLLARAVAALPNSTPETRKAIYDRAKKALLGQLHAMQPPPPQGAIDREAQALDEAVARLESEFAVAAIAKARAEEAPSPADAYPGDEAPEGEPSRDEASTRDNLRPAAPRPVKQESGGLRRLVIILGALAGVGALVGFAAWKLRDRPEDLAKLAPPTENANPESGAKIGQRVGGENVAQPEPNAGPTLPIAYRAAVLTRDPSEPGGVKTYVGTVVWRRDSTNRGPNQQLVSAIHADVDIPDAKLKTTLVIEKNFDPSLSFSHTINVRFIPGDGSPIGAINAIGMPEMRADEAPKGVALQGLPVQIAANAFLAGLNQTSAEQNRALLDAPNWMDIQLSLANGSIAKITMEKGAGGRKVFSDVLAEWNGK
ncbi:hypothetical protein CCR94_19475 [Rhodoblastus sphagnicola]|uniref:Uncharacterized protein n=1 Tax=Rhodoblastus sphagnicola TaxID=333368 RepID=A0A2S6MZ85_9HYPH|nr:hypothetical protein [Rhodoblastus sphagnicola]MBB4198628.1 hypothetical protein [Rhodoblastus sphagnicola]PPQ27656.1 hypothetical protein CCR94_19475 [Rhodoblastus sphagnicola]